MKIDTTKIDGYAEMTAEQKLQALEAYEYEDNTSEVTRLSGELDRYKNAVTRANAEAKKYKDEKLAAMSADEKAKAETAELIKSLQEQNETLKKAQEVASYEAQFVALGYTSELAKETALAQASGDFGKVMANHKAFLDSAKTKMQAEALKQQPQITPGNPKTKAELEEAEMNKLRHYAGLI